jgi:hypothetical protein
MVSEFDRVLHASLGEFAPRGHKAVLKKADFERLLIDIDDQRHYWNSKSRQEHKRPFGEIVVWRSVYRANGEKAVSPLKVNLGILLHHLTHAPADFVSI